jgi:radical SAM superfamily enzyme YgiQ (UPF0313 family)
MHITFIRPSIYAGRARDAMEPLAFALLAGLTPPEHSVALYDERVEDIPFEQHTDLVAITIETYTARRAYQIAAKYRQRGVPVVAGGYHVKFLPDEALHYVDAVVLGDGELLWKQILADVQSKSLKLRYSSEMPPLTGLNYERSIFKGRRYTPVLPVQFSRGCRYACDFCSIHAFYGTSVRHRPVEEIVEEIRASGKRFVLIVDDNIFVNVDDAKKLFEALIPLKVRWGCQISIDIAWDEELLDLMERSGCIAALVGFESLDRNNLWQMAKGWNLKQGSYKEAVARFYQHGIMVYGSFIFGYDHDSRDCFATTVQFALDANFFIVNFSGLQPTPATRLYERLKEEGRLIYEQWWLDPAYRYGDISYHPLQMSAGELAQGCYQARMQFYSYRSVFQRLRCSVNRQSLSHLFLYLGANWINRYELKQKLGRSLGGIESLELPAQVLNY